MKKFYFTILLISSILTGFAQDISVIVNNDEGVCGATVNGIEPVWSFEGWESATVLYIIEGATTGVGTDDASGTTFNTGNSTVTYFAINNGETPVVIDTFYVGITVNDAELPQPICQNVSVSLDSNGMATITAGQIDNGSSDNCGIDELSLDITDFSCEMLGENIVTLTATDEAGNSATCEATVTVSDDRLPELKLHPITIDLFDHGEYILSESDKMKIIEGTTDNCSSVNDLQVTVFPNSFECVHVGDSVKVRVFVTDNNGNSTESSTKIWVNDFTSPVAICKDIDLVLDDNGEARIFAGQINASENRESTPDWARRFNHLEGGSYDACGVKSLQLDKYKFDCNDVGDNIVTLTAKDVSGNIGTCKATVSVSSKINPSVVCRDLTIELDSDGHAKIDKNQIIEDIKGVCGVADVIITPENFDCSNLGENEVKISVVDKSGNVAECTASVTVEDNITPDIIQQNNIDLTIEPGKCETEIANYPDIVAFDNCGVETTLKSGLGKNGLFPLGTTTETWVATDAAGNAIEMSFDINVSTYNAPPTIDKIEDLSLKADTNAVLVKVTGIGVGNDCREQSVESVTVTSSDSEIATAAINFIAGTDTAVVKIIPYNEGNCTVNVTVTDNGGTNNNGTDTAVQSFNVLVEKEDVVVVKNPWASCDDASLVLDENGTAELSSNDINLTYGDFDGTETVKFSKSEFDCDAIGENAIEITVSDNSGNSATCSAVIAVEDTIMPTLAPVDDVEIVVQPGLCETTIANYPEIVANDNCSYSVELVSGLGADGVFPLGTTVETWRVTDSYGNQSEMSFNVVLSTYNDAPSFNQLRDTVISKDSGAVEIEISGITTGNDCESQRIIGVIVSSSNKSIVTASVVYNPGEPTAKLTLTPGETGKVNITLVVLDNGGKENGGTDLATQIFKVEVVESKKATEVVDYAHFFDLKMYPNPSAGTVNFDINSSNISDVDIAIYSITGEKVMQRFFRAGENVKINMGENISGLYLVKINTEGKQIIKKLVLEKQ